MADLGNASAWDRYIAATDRQRTAYAVFRTDPSIDNYRRLCAAGAECTRLLEEYRQAGRAEGKDEDEEEE